MPGYFLLQNKVEALKSISNGFLMIVGLVCNEFELYHIIPRGTHSYNFDNRGVRFRNERKTRRQ